MKQLFILLAVGVAAQAAPAATLVGTVVRIVDGDTLILQPSDDPTGKARPRIGFVAIDAPDPGQAKCAAARDGLQHLVGKTVTVADTKPDTTSARTQGRVLFEGRDIGLDQVRAGNAWYARAFASQLALPDQGYYLAAESAARTERSGIWGQSPPPTPPWLFRRPKVVASSTACD